MLPTTSLLQVTPSVSLTGQTGQCPDPDDTSEIEKLRKEVERLTLENETLSNQNGDLSMEIQNLKALSSGGGDQDPEDVPNELGLTDEAQRKRLERICKKKSDGILSSDLNLFSSIGEQCWLCWLCFLTRLPYNKYDVVGQLPWPNQGLSLSPLRFTRLGKKVGRAETISSSYLPRRTSPRIYSETTCWGKYGEVIYVKLGFGKFKLKENPNPANSYKSVFGLKMVFVLKTTLSFASSQRL